MECAWKSTYSETIYYYGVLLSLLLFVVVVGLLLSHNANHHLPLQKVDPVSELSNKKIARLAGPSRLLVRKSDVNREGYVQR